MDEKDLLKKYKPPIKGKEFKHYWLRFISNSVNRDNFSESHLKNLEIFCKLYVEYDRMSFELDNHFGEHGTYTHVSEGRYGVQIKPHPMLTERKTLLAEIRQYSKMLDIVLSKDKTQKPDEEAGEWV